MSAKTIEARVSISTNSAVAGRYVVDVRNTTGGRDIQMMVKTTDTPAVFVADLTAKGLEAGVFVELIDETGE